jgi:MFS family permease
MSAAAFDRAEGKGAVPASNELRAHWPVILACFVTAILAWGLGFYGQSVYVAELQRLNGWSATLVSAATTLYYLVGAFFLTFVPNVLERFGPRALLLGGACFLVLGAATIARSTAPWQLFAGNLVLALGWAATTSTAIATVLALWFDRRRGFALSLALNGASAAGFTALPALVFLAGRWGLADAVLAFAGVTAALLVPLVLWALRGGRRSPASPAGADGGDALPTFGGRGAVLRDVGFWTIALGFALALVVQVGYLVHQISFLLPALGTSATGIAVSAASVAAMIGRLGMGAIIDRLEPRAVSAASFSLQSAALLLMAFGGGAPATLYVGSIVFGLSVGNVITLPALIIQREVHGHSFALVLGLSTAIGQVFYAFGPTLIGAVHDVLGGYRGALVLCAAIDLAAALIVIAGRRRRLVPR